MKRVLVIATLLMVSCGGNQSNNNTAEEPAPLKASQKFEKKELPELHMKMPKKAPTEVHVITADKDIDYINSRKAAQPTEE